MSEVKKVEAEPYKKHDHIRYWRVDGVVDGPGTYYIVPEGLVEPLLKMKVMVADEHRERYGVFPLIIEGTTDE